MADKFKRCSPVVRIAQEDGDRCLRKVDPLSPTIDPGIPMEVVESVEACDVTALSVVKHSQSPPQVGSALAEKPYGMKARRTASFRNNDDTRTESSSTSRKYNSLPRPTQSFREIAFKTQHPAPTGNGRVATQTSLMPPPLIALASVSTVTASDALEEDEPVKVMQVCTATPVTSANGKQRTHLSVSSLLRQPATMTSRRSDVTSQDEPRQRHFAVRSKSTSRKPRNVGYMRCESEVTTELVRCSDLESVSSSAPAVLDRSVRKQVLEMDAVGGDGDDDVSECSVTVRTP